MKVLHVVPTYVPAWRHGGPVYAVHGLCKALAARGHQVTVLTTDVDGSGTLGPEVPRAAPVRVEGVTAWYFPVAAPRRLYRSPQLAAALRRTPAGGAGGAGGAAAAGTAAGGFDIVHLHSIFLWPTAAAAAAARRARVPYVISPRGMLVGDLLRRRGRLRKSLWIALVERRNLRHAAALHATSQLEAGEAARLGLRLPPVAVIPNGVDLHPGAPAPAGSMAAAGPLAAAPSASPATAAAVREALARRPLLLFLGRVSWKKGLDRLIQALALVPGATLAIAGNDEESYQPRLEALAAGAGAGVAARVRFVGAVAGADKAALLAGADLLVLPSYSENFGNVVLEAMAAGLPVAVTPEVGAARLVTESGAGIVTSGDPPALAAALAALLADAPRRREMGRRGIAAAGRFAWPEIAARMEQLYHEVLER